MITKLLLTAAATLALTATATLAETRYEPDARDCASEYGHERTIYLGKGIITFGELELRRVSAIEPEKYWRHAVYEVFSEGMSLGPTQVSFSTLATGGPYDLTLMIDAIPGQLDEVITDAVACN